MKSHRHTIEILEDYLEGRRNSLELTIGSIKTCREELERLESVKRSYELDISSLEGSIEELKDKSNGES